MSFINPIVANTKDFTQNPVRKIRNNGFAALLLVGILYTLANIAYFSAGAR